MPVSLRIAKLSTILKSPSHCPMVPSTKYKFLGDIILFRTRYKVSAISIGDILYVCGYIFLGFYIWIRLTIFLVNF